jgi:hypothetical protein
MPCPEGMVVKEGVEFFSQCDPSHMGEGSDCWHDGVPPERPNIDDDSDANSYCESACGVASTKMALHTYGIEKAARDLFCGGPDTVYRPGGSNPGLITEVTGRLGLTTHELKQGVDWDDIVSNILQGKVIVFHLSEPRSEAWRNQNLERSRGSSGHYIFLFGAGDQYVIAHDPGRRDPANAANLVLSKEYIEEVGTKYIVLGR